MSKQNLSATIDHHLLKKLNHWSEQTERNRSWLISKAVENYLDELEDLEIARERLHDPRLTPAGLRKKIHVPD